MTHFISSRSVYVRYISILYTLLFIFIPITVIAAVTPIGDNLVENPGLAQGNRTTKMPNNWRRDHTVNEQHQLDWVDDPDGGKRGKVLKSLFTGDDDSRGNLPQVEYTSWKSDSISVKKNTWYKIAVDMAYENIRPIFQSEGEDKKILFKLADAQFATMHEYSSLAGIQFIIQDAQGIQVNRWNMFSMYINGPTMSDWDEFAGVYRTVQEFTPFSGWKRYVRYIKTPPNAETIVLCTRQYPPGEIYFDNFLLQEIDSNCDPTIPPLQKSGTLRFMQYQGKDFFPIVLWGFPHKEGTRGTQDIDAAKIKEYGFNTILASIYTNANENNGKIIDGGNPDFKWDPGDITFKEWLRKEGLAVIVSRNFEPEFAYHKIGKEPGKVIESDYWVNDPGHKVQYTGEENFATQIKSWSGFENLFGFFYGDETNNFPFKNGSYIPNHNGYRKTYEMYRDNTQSDPQFPPYVQTNSLDPYTGIRFDNINYLQFTDISSVTWNVPESYPYWDPKLKTTMEPLMGDLGAETRKMIQLMKRVEKDTGRQKWFMALGLGAFNWSGWDGITDYELGRYVPFNLQRFQVFDQIINGATGVWFCGTFFNDYEGTNQDYYIYQHKQMYQLTRELKQYYDILLEPQFYSSWSISDSRIEAMMKKHNGNLYLFTASTAYEDIKNVTITLNIASNYKISSVTALNDVVNGDRDVIEGNKSNPNARRQIVPSSANSFKDDFVGEDASAPQGKFQGKAAPGYAVHVYEITLSKVYPSPAKYKKLK